MNTIIPDQATLGSLPANEILKVPEVARYLRISRGQGYALVRRGVIPSFSVGGSPRVRRSELLKWIDGQ